jgi:hypothetical protein
MKPLLTIFVIWFTVLYCFGGTTTVSVSGFDTRLFEGQDLLWGVAEKGMDARFIKIHYKKKKEGWHVLYAHNKRKAVHDFFYDPNTGMFRVRLKKPLSRNSWLKLEYANPADPAAYPVEPVKPSPLIIKPLGEGSQYIEGSLNTEHLGGPDRFPLILKCLLTWDEEPVWMEDRLLPDKRLPDLDQDPFSFNVKIFRPLRDGDEVAVSLIDAKSGESILTKTYFISQRVIDWGMIRTYLTLGFNISREGGKLTSNGSYLDFLLTTCWRTSEYRRNNLIMAHVDVRLHSFNAGDKNDSNNEESKETLKNAVVEFGLHYPFLIGEWQHQGRKNAIFAGPIVKTGFQRFYNGNLGNEMNYLEEDQLYPFLSFGLRSGHFLKSPNVNQAHRLCSYFDVTVGWSSTIGVVSDDKTAISDRSFNVYLEARIKIPTTSFTLGFNAYKNISRGDIQDDFRIILGTRLDLLTLIDRLLPRN